MDLIIQVAYVDFGQLKFKSTSYPDAFTFVSRNESASVRGSTQQHYCGRRCAQR